MNPKTILVVDDEAPIRDMLRVALEMAEYQVLEAPDAQEAHAIILDAKPDLILLDWMMPGTSGVELARRPHAVAPGAVQVEPLVAAQLVAEGLHGRDDGARARRGRSVGAYAMRAK